jgi:hypothetical protein
LPVVLLFLAIIGIIFYGELLLLYIPCYNFQIEIPTSLTTRRRCLSHPDSRTTLHLKYPMMELTSGLVGEAGTGPTTPKHPQEVHHQDLAIESDAPRQQQQDGPITDCDVSPKWKQIHELTAMDSDVPPSNRFKISPSTQKPLLRSTRVSLSSSTMYPPRGNGLTASPPMTPM